MNTRALQTPAWLTALVAIGFGIALVGDQAHGPTVGLATGPALAPSSSSLRQDLTDEDLTAVVQRTCVVCHNDQMRTADLTLQAFDVAAAAERAEAAEKMIAKLRAGMMPPPGMPRPGADTLLALVERLEGKIDEAAEDMNNVGDRSFQRLNEAEYERSIHELLGLEVDAAKWLPLDQRQANFDNVVDVQVMSTTLLEAYLSAAGEISRLAVGDPMASPEDAQYRAARWLSQTDRVDGAPIGTRGGVSVTHIFPADGEYVFRASFHAEAGGAQLGEWRSALGSIEHPEQLEISIDGERVALLDFDPWWQDLSPGVFDLTTEPIPVKAGPKRVSAAFVRRLEGPVQDLVRPHDWSAASTAIGGTYGILSLPQLRDFVIVGPHNVTGVSEHPVRERIFTCRPASPAEEGACALEIVSRLASSAYRRPPSEGELVDLMRFYESGAKEGGFEIGVRTALTAILASPYFVFRMEREPAGLKPGTPYPISDFDLASRLSFFLWAQPPSDELLDLARQGRLSDPDVLEAQVRRMLKDPRSEALATRFASQWLRLHDLESLQPSVRLHPDFHEQLREAMRRETEQFFYYLVREDRSLMEFYTADYTFVNELLARHYGFSGVVGDHFRRVQYPDGRRRGILGHASVLASTSHATRTSPTIRGKWVMEVILGTPPPPPPPVPSLDETKAVAEDGRQRTTRERMEIHRAAATCRACHQYMDPIGIALEHFDVTGGYRPTDYGLPMDTRGQLYDGTPVSNLEELLNALLARPVPLVRTFTSNLMVYALGRRVEWYDKPTVRAIVRQAEKNDYRMSEFIVGVVKSDAFRMRRATGIANN